MASWPTSIEHLGQVFTFWRTQLEAAAPEARTEPESSAMRPRSDLMDWFEDAGASSTRRSSQPRARRALLELVGRGPHRPLGLPAHGARVGCAPLRRRALGRLPAPIDRDLAVDGIDEWLAVHLATDVPEAPDASLGGVLCLACADDPAAWTVEVAGGRLRWREGRGPADAVLVGSASDLYLYSWNRLALDALDLTGKPDVAGAWGTLTN